MRLNLVVSAIALSMAIASPVVVTPSIASAQLAVIDAGSIANTAKQLTQMKVSVYLMHLQDFQASFLNL